MDSYSGTIGYQEKSWVFSHGDEVLDTDITTPAFMQLITGESYTISTTLSYDGRGDKVPTCFFFVDHMHCRVFLDGEEIFSYTPDDVVKPDKSKSPGNVYVSALLPKDCLGKELSIEFIPALSSDIEYRLPNPSFGDYLTTAQKTFKSELVHNLTITLSAAIGVLCFLVATTVLPDSKYKEGIFIASFATLFAFYEITESDFDFYLLANPYYTYAIDYTSFSLIPLFIMAFIRERLDGKQKKFSFVMIIIALLMCTAELVLHVSGIMDAREFLPVLHIVYGIDFAVIFAMLVFFKKNRRKKQLIRQMIPMLVGMVIDSSIYYMHWQLGTGDSTFTALGVLIFLISELYHVWKYSMEVYTDAVWSKTYREMAFADALTGIGNRRAFDVEENAIATKQRKFKKLIVASVDINELKFNNDSYGHAAGDFLIRSAAELLTEFCQDYGYAFRVGGDEFIVIIYDMDEKEFRKRLKIIEESTRQINSNSEINLSLSMGFDVCQNSDFETALKNADRYMYMNKSKFKADKARQ